MTCSLEDAVGLLQSWQSASKALAFKFVGAVVVAGTGRVTGVSPPVISISLDGDGSLEILLIDPLLFSRVETPQSASALLIDFLLRDQQLFLCELLPGEDFFPDVISDS